MAEGERIQYDKTCFYIEKVFDCIQGFNSTGHPAENVFQFVFEDIFTVEDIGFFDRQLRFSSFRSCCFLVGAFSLKEKSPTITVASFFFFFFSSDHRAHRVCTTFYRN